MANDLRNFLELSYDELEQLNLEAKEQRKNRVAIDKIQEARLKYLTDEKRIKAVTVLFSDLEGRLHMLDYDKKFLIKSWDNLTFDGSSIRGFTAQRESALRLGICWDAFYWAPADIFGTGKILVFADVVDKDGTPYGADIRGLLKGFAGDLYKKKGYTLNGANEIEGFLFQGADAERRYHETNTFSYVNTGGYYHSLPGDPLRTFIDTTAEVQRAMGFQNEKDHPEVAPSQFEINYGYGEVVAAADQIKASAVDRVSMIRIPIGNEKSMRVEVRSVAPDANPYLVMYSIFKAGVDGETAKIKNLRQAERYLPANIYTALDHFRNAEWTTTLLGADVKGRYADLKQASADRCPRQLGPFLKAAEVHSRHEVSTT